MQLKEVKRKKRKSRKKEQNEYEKDVPFQLELEFIKTIARRPSVRNRQGNVMKYNRISSVTPLRRVNVRLYLFNR